VSFYLYLPQMINTSRRFKYTIILNLTVIGRAIFK